THFPYTTLFRSTPRLRFVGQTSLQSCLKTLPYAQPNKSSRRHGPLQSKSRRNEPLATANSVVPPPEHRKGKRGRRRPRRPCVAPSVPDFKCHILGPVGEREPQGRALGVPSLLERRLRLDGDGLRLPRQEDAGVRRGGRGAPGGEPEPTVLDAFA